MSAHDQPYDAGAHKDSAASIFGRFLKFGLLAWGGPAAQIAMIKRECVDEEGWVDEDTFRKTLAVYQVLPGPEAHELCATSAGSAAASWAAGVIGLIAAVTVDIVDTGVVDVPTSILAIAGFLVLNRRHGKLTVLYVVLGCGAIGATLQLSGLV